jgi:hypothetical protein
LESDLATPMSSLGRLNRRVNVELYPVGTPLPEGYEPFVDKTGVQPLAMVHSPPVDEEESMGLKARCRLSSNRLRQLTKRFGMDLVDLHPLDKMTEFPYTPVRVSRSTFIPVEGQNPNNASLFVEKPFSKVYCQESPFQDISTPLPDVELNIQSSVPEDWETQDISLVLVSHQSSPSTVAQPASSRNHEGRRRRVLDKERNATNRGLIYRRTPLEESYFQ